MNKLLLVLILILILPFVFSEESSSSINWASKTYVDNNFCMFDGVCTLNTLITQNLTVLEFINMSVTVIDYNITGNMTIGGCINLNGTAFCDLSELFNTVEYFDPNQFSAIAGTVDGVLSYVSHNDTAYDSITINITEAVGSPALDIRVNFTSITTFSAGIMRYYTTDLKGDLPVIQLWDYSEEEWEDYPVIGESSSFAIIFENIFDPSSHIQDGIIQMRIYKAAAGNTQNTYYVDWMAVLTGSNLLFSSEVDPYSIHTTAINTTDFYYDGHLTLNRSNLLTGVNGTTINATNVADKRSATLIVAASDSLNKEGADYICDGVDDDLTIEQAMGALPSTGGTILLLDGFYYINESVDFPSDKIHLKGVGRSSHITDIQASPVIAKSIYLPPNIGNITISDLSVSSYSGGRAIYIYSLNDNVRIHDTFIYSHAFGIHAWNPTPGYPQGSLIVNNNDIYINKTGGFGIGIALYQKTDVIIQNNFIQCDNNYPRVVDLTGTGIETNYFTSYVTVSNNVIRDCSFGIWAHTTNNLLISSNSIDRSDDTGIMFYSDINDSIITSNIITNANDSGITIGSATPLSPSNNNLIFANRISNSIPYQNTAYGITISRTNGTMILNNNLIGTKETIFNDGNDTTILGNYPGGSSMEIQTATGQEIKMKPEGILTSTLFPENTTHIIHNSFESTTQYLDESTHFDDINITDKSIKGNINTQMNINTNGTWVITG